MPAPKQLSAAGENLQMGRLATDLSGHSALPDTVLPITAPASSRVYDYTFLHMPPFFKPLSDDKYFILHLK